MAQHDNEVYTTTFADVEKTASEFGCVALDLPEHDQVIIFDKTMIGHGMIKQFERNPYGLTRARRFAVRMDEDDETSEKSFEEIVQEHRAYLAAEN